MAAQSAERPDDAVSAPPISADSLLGSMTDTVLVLDKDARWVWAAPTLLQQSPPARQRMEWLIGKRIPDVMADPVTAERLIRVLNSALETGSTQYVDYEVDVWGTPMWFSAAVSRIDENHVLWVARDITDRIHANKRLEESVEERTREVNALLEVSSALSSATTLTELAEAILIQLKRVIDYTGAAVVQMEGTSITILDSVGPGGREQEIVGMTLDMAVAPEWWEQLREGRAVVIEDARQDGGRPFRELLAGYQELPAFTYIRSWMAVPLLHEERLVGMLSLSKDVPDYFTDNHIELATAVARQAAVVFENAALFEQAQRKTRELAALLDVSRALASTLELKPLLELILDRLQEFVPFAGAAISLREGDYMRQVVVRRPRGGTVSEEDTQRIFPLQTYTESITGGAAVIDDVRSDDPLAIAYREPYGGSLEGTPVEYVKSFVSFPLVSRGEIVGALTMAHDTIGYFTPERVESLLPLADNAAIAIANAELFEKIDKRTRELSGLLEVSRTVASTLDLTQVMRIVLDELTSLVGNTGASILTVEGTDLVFSDAMDVPGRAEQIGQRIPLSTAGIIWDHLCNREQVIIPDVQAKHDPIAIDYRRIINSLGMLDRPPFNRVRSWMSVPLFVQDRIIGMLSMSRTMPNYFTPDHARLARIFADNVAVAIENARLFQQAQGVAALEERQHLARELHDSVSQALYGIALGARTAREQLDRDATKAAEPVDYVLSLAEAGLAEMRALIFELRPESLESEGLVAAIEKQAAALQARHRIEVTRNLCAEPAVSMPVKQAAYRIVQEAFTNIMKHAGAQAVSVTLALKGDRLWIEITDNGRGFDPSADYAGHLGLHSMRERASKVGGELTIESGSGSGTRIVATLPAG